MSALNELINKLEEIFQIDRSDLDFGIYRILNTRSDEIKQYLRAQLPQAVKNALGVNNPNETAVYNHLLTFFSRYYDAGDFISQRRYKGETYAIPYSGEEVMLHWANKDQYYTKSGEYFANYRFTVEEKQIAFRLVSADTSKDNQKEKDRVFTLANEQVIEKMDDEGESYEEVITPFAELADGTLEIRFEYKKTGEKQTQAVQSSIEKLAKMLPESWQTLLFALAPTEKNAKRTVLEKHLTDYTTKNTADYFIHKDLGGFLRRELDFYIKNEVMNLDNLQSADDFSQIERSLAMIQTLRQIAQELIAFLAQLENFQKKLWLKKKFVVGSHYLISLDKVPSDLHNEVFANPKQLAQWQQLYNFQSPPPQQSDLSLSTVSSQKFQHLIVDTSLFTPEFQAKLLTSLSIELETPIDDAIDGVLIHSDNFQALNLLQTRYREQVKCIYIDPPYNTDGDGFLYKDSYKSSSWISMFENRLTAAIPYLGKTGLFASHIDEHEHLTLECLINHYFQGGNCGKLIWDKRNPKGVVKGLATQHEYIHFATTDVDHLIAEDAFVRNKENAEDMLNKAEKLIKKYGITEQTKKEYQKWVQDNDKLSGGENAYKLIDENGDIYQPVSMAAPDKPETRSHRPLIHPVTNKPCPVPAKGWRFTDEKMDLLLSQNRIVFGNDETVQPRNKYLLKEHLTEAVSTLYYMGGSDEAFFNNINISFKDPKPVKTAMYCLKAMARPQNSLILDYFAGSGTTAHAVINLNREDQGKRKYILVEQGEYFDTVLKPRVQKVLYAKDWKDGKPVEGENGLGGVSQIVKVLKLESYEDTLNNLELKTQDLLTALSQEAQKDYLLHYMLETESRGSLLNTDIFSHPFYYELNISQDSAGAYQPQTVDLVETFNYLLGLRVATVNDQRYQRSFVLIEGQLPNQTGDKKTLVIWRDCTQWDYDKLPELLRTCGIDLAKEEYAQAFINGDHNLPTVWTTDDGITRTLKIRQTEAEFLRLMFEGAE